MEKDGTGSCTTKPKSEWRTKKSGKRKAYWEQWDTKDDNLSDEARHRLAERMHENYIKRKEKENGTEE